SALYEEEFDIKTLANYPLSGGQIQIVLKNTALKVALKKEPIFTLEDFKEAIERESKGAFGESNAVGFLK
ncbi:MAG: AAA family ATPase, partial [Campylobacteraceae bacterium]|nr:AAA family ATPase [Campylobacteraceae bacterium]